MSDESAIAGSEGAEAAKFAALMQLWEKAQPFAFQVLKSQGCTETQCAEFEELLLHFYFRTQADMPQIKKRFRGRLLQALRESLTLISEDAFDVWLELTPFLARLNVLSEATLLRITAKAKTERDGAEQSAVE